MWPILFLVGMGGLTFVSMGTTVLQLLVPKAMMGRVMSVVMFVNLGLFPLSSALAGYLAKLDLDLMMYGAGGTLIAVCVLGFCLPGIRRIGVST